MKQKIRTLLVALAVLGGLFFIGVSVNYLVLFFSEPDNLSRHEYLQGVVIALLLSMPFWLAATASLLQVREIVPKSVFLSVNSITALVCVSLLLIYINPSALWLLVNEIS